MRDYFDPTPEEQVVVLVESKTLRRAERLIESCEHFIDDLLTDVKKVY
jgi:hypothetical protein